MSETNEGDDAVEGLPEALPEGEEIIWQGRPQWRVLARRIFKLRWLVVYFGVFAALRTAMAILEAEGTLGAIEVARMVALSLLGLGMLAGIAYLQARTTMYTITTHRVVMQVGVAIPITWNLPFSSLAAADLNARSDRDGDIVLQLAGEERIGWIFLWPHVQPGHIARARPMLRGLARPREVASLLQGAARAWSQRAAQPLAMNPLTDDRNPTPVGSWGEPEMVRS
ncbi:MAG: photosynthetic complex putative assembly protein PuhB [Myxococcota bacterium]